MKREDTGQFSLPDPHLTPVNSWRALWERVGGISTVAPCKCILESSCSETQIPLQPTSSRSIGRVQCGSWVRVQDLPVCPQQLDFYLPEPRDVLYFLCQVALVNFPCIAFPSMPWPIVGAGDTWHVSVSVTQMLPSGFSFFRTLLSQAYQRAFQEHYCSSGRCISW